METATGSLPRLQKGDQRDFVLQVRSAFGHEKESLDAAEQRAIHQPVISMTKKE
jgi:hypothetical protein